MTDSKPLFDYDTNVELSASQIADLAGKEVLFVATGSFADEVYRFIVVPVETVLNHPDFKANNSMQDNVQNVFYADVRVVGESIEEAEEELQDLIEIEAECFPDED